MNVRLATIVTSMIGCNYPPPADVIVTCDACLLASVHPALAKSGDTVWFEGTFESDAVAMFPAASPIEVPLVLDGPHRAHAIVPDGAGAGVLTIVQGAPIGSLWFRGVPFTPALESAPSADGGAQIACAIEPIEPMITGPIAFDDSLVFVGGFMPFGGPNGSLVPSKQVLRLVARVDGGLATPKPSGGLQTARGIPMTAAVGRSIYAIGGYDTSFMQLDSVERADIVDGELGDFVALDTHLAIPRVGGAIVVVGNFLYVVGGNSQQSQIPYDFVERAEIFPDGTLAAFEILPDVKLVTGRSGAVAEVIGDSVYVIGGTGMNAFHEIGPLATIERAAIGDDGSIGPFADDPHVLATARTQFGSVQLGDRLVVMGGASTDLTPEITSIETATIDAAGSLGEFAVSRDPGISLGSALAIGTSVYSGSVGLENSTPLRRFALGTGELGAFVADDTSLGTARSGAACIPGHGRIFVIGGATSGVPTMGIESAPIDQSARVGAFAASVEMLDAPRSDAVTARFGDRLFVLGGDGASGALASIATAQLGTDDTLSAFTKVSGISLTTARAGAAAVVLPGQPSRLYVIGGRDSGGAALGSIEATTLVAHDVSTFQSLAISLQSPRSGHSVAVAGGYVYVIGGRDGSGPLASVERALIDPDGSIGAFTVVQGVSLLHARARHASALVGDTMYVFGGSGAETTIERSRLQANGDLSAFETSGTLSVGRDGPCAFPLGAELVVAGGDTSGSVERAPLHGR